MKTLLITIAAAFIASGCASLQYAGNAEYSVQPFKASDGSILCCQVSIKNGKEIANLEAHIVKNADGYTVDLKEQGVAAFAGQSIASDSAKQAVTDAAKAGVAAALAPVLPALTPAAGAALASPGIGAAAVGAGAAIGIQKIAPQ